MVRRAHRRGVRLGSMCAAVGALSIGVLAVGVVLPQGAAQASTNLPIGTLWTGIWAALSAPASSPPGANDWSCRPSSEHPYPVVLVHGTFASMADSWQALSPMLANAGYCVFAFDYGQTWPGTPFYGTADIAQSAAQLSSFVDEVRAATGASQVDIVGHSQGGMMPRYYLKFLGGAASVHMLVALAPSNHGTTLDGLSALVDDFEALGFPSLSTLGCPACDEQLAGSSFLQELNAGGDTVPGPRYVVIETAYDEVVTPYTSAFLSGPDVENILLQQQCWDDFSDHLGILYDMNALSDVLNALGSDDPGFQPSCQFTLPVVGG